MIEIYKSEGKRQKTYLVSTGKNRFETFDAMKRYFHKSENQLKVGPVWIIGKDLYLENPHKRGQKKTWAAWIRRKDE